MAQRPITGRPGILYEAPHERDWRARGFEKERALFFREPIGRGYDDGIIAAIAILEMMDRAGGKKFSALVADLPKHGLAHHGAALPGRQKYDVVAALTKEYEAAKASGEKFLVRRL